MQGLKPQLPDRKYPRVQRSMRPLYIHAMHAYLTATTRPGDRDRKPSEIHQLNCQQQRWNTFGTWPLVAESCTIWSRPCELWSIIQWRSEMQKIYTQFHQYELLSSYSHLIVFHARRNASYCPNGQTASINSICKLVKQVGKKGLGQVLNNVVQPTPSSGFFSITPVNMEFEICTRITH